MRAHVVVARTPEPSEKEPTKAQRAARFRFVAAQEYMKKVLADPCQAEAYDVLAKALKRRADKIVAGDFLNPPEVQRIDVGACHGQPGERITILAIAKDRPDHEGQGTVEYS